MESDNTIQLIETLGKAGLVERVSAEILASGTEHLEELAELVANKKYPRVLGLGDDFVPETKLYSVLGALYPQLPREKKDRVIGACLSQMDKVNLVYVQNNHTAYIREPLLLADICITRGVYWPGLEEAEHAIKKITDFADFERVYMIDGLFKTDKVQNDFCMGYALLRKDMSSFGTEFAKACRPSFLERVVAGVIGMRFARAQDEVEVQTGKSRLTELLPSAVYGLLEEKYHQKSWIDPARFS